ncbi:MAG: hypothetical protein K6E13_04095 [Lachnospiraceae bacterium]|nr:hypothetical protein [Lachnospiraceae bacterium]
MENEVISQHRENFITVICQHNPDGSVIPRRIKILDEDGEYQTYTIHAYKVLDNTNKVRLPSEVWVSSSIVNYECKITVFETEKRLRLIYRKYDGKWILRNIF